MPAKMTREDALETIRVFKENGCDIQKTVTALDISRSALRQRWHRIKANWPDIEIPDTVERVSSRAVTDAQLVEVMNALVRSQGVKRQAARALGMEASLFGYYCDIAEQRGISATVRGNSDAPKPAPAKLPKKGEIKRYILTCAQNDTLIHEPTWQALNALASHYDAELMVATLTYKSSADGSAKRGTERSRSDKYDPRIEPYVVDEMRALAPTLVWNGNVNILPTATDPLSGWENYNFRASSIFPHVKCAMRSIPTVRADGAKLQYTTGTVTTRNYIQKKAGQKAEFDHVYGGLLVEVNHEGRWWARQLNVDSRGELYDLDVVVRANGRVQRHDGVEAIQFGDVHVAQMEDEMMHATWGEGGMVDALRPRMQFMHDLLDFEARSHHNLRDPFKVLELHAKKRDSVEDEIKEIVDFLIGLAQRDYCQTIIVESNHDLHFERWLRDTSWKSDPLNARIHTKATAAFIESIHAGTSFSALKWALEEYGPVANLTWADPDEGFVILKDESGGVEMGLHGDLGPNGARGSIRNLSRLGRKVCIGHSHSAGIHNGAYQSGVKARLNMDYTRGAPSSWTQSDIVVYPNGKRQIITWYDGKYRA